MASKGSPTTAIIPIVEQPLSTVLSERYLSYALSTIMSRSLPDVRDGLKPVHRRLLFAMYQLHLNPDSPPKKSARVVGDVIGKFHPHGDVAVYDALVRLAQDFAVRYPLIDGQGNFGNIDGDNAAAMRYTESRLTAVALALLDGIDADAVDFRPTYDNSEQEPIVLPAAFPNLLANGASGIAVGMATNIPPHNVGEICAALLMMLDKDPTVEELVACIPGPDFPTGGILIEPRDSILESYRTGRGSFRLRARWMKEELKGGQYQIVVTEIPYQVQKSRLIESIATLIHDRKIPMLDDVRDESAEDVRVVIVPKSRNVEPELLMEALFRHCDLEVRISLNMNVLDGGLTPRVMPLRDVLRAFLDHRQEVLVRCSRHRLEKVKHRLEVLAGYLIVYLNLDEVIRIIRESDEPKPELMAAFGLSDIQAEAILNMRLRNLRKLEEMELRREHDQLARERDELEKLIASEALQWDAIRRQIVATDKAFGKGAKGGARRTDLAAAPAPVAIDSLAEALIEKEPVTVLLSDKGWVRAMKGHGLSAADFRYKDGDAGRFVVEAQTTDKLLVFATNGRFYALSCDKLPPGRGFGEPVRMMFDLPNDADILSLMLYRPEQEILIAGSGGRGFIAKGQDVFAQTKAGKQVLSLDDGEKAILCLPIDGAADHLATIGNNRKMLVFPLAEIPRLGKGKGVMLQRIKDGQLVDAKVLTLAQGLTFTGPRGGTTTVTDFLPWLGHRAGTGRMPPNGFPKNNRFE